MKDTMYKVLLVEDNEIERRAFERFVESNEIPYDCVYAKSVSEAQRELACKKFDIVITDHDLGDGSAIDVLRSVNDAPVIVVTGAGDQETAVNAWKSGAYDYLIKDIDQNYLKAIPITVENAIKHRVIEQKLQLLSGAVRSTEDSVYITNMCGEIIFINKAFCKTYGYSEDEIVGKNSSILWINKNQCENIRSVFQTRSMGGGWEVGFYHKRKDNSIFPVSLSRSIIKDANKKDVAIVSVARDISERLIVEDELRSTSLKLQKRIQMQNEIAVIATEAIQKLIAGGRLENASKVISDFLDISRINAGAIELNRTCFNFASLVWQVINSLSVLTSEKNIILKCSDRRPEFEINADYDKMTQVMKILLLVCIKFSPKNTNINIELKSSGSELTVELHNACFDFECSKIYHAVNNSEWIRQQFDAGREDMALGLRIAKEFVEIHTGRMWTEKSDQNSASSPVENFVVERVEPKRGAVLCFTVQKAPSAFMQEEELALSAEADRKIVSARINS